MKPILIWMLVWCVTASTAARASYFFPENKETKTKKSCLDLMLEKEEEARAGRRDTAVSFLLANHWSPGTPAWPGRLLSDIFPDLSGRQELEESFLVAASRVVHHRGKVTAARDEKRGAWKVVAIELYPLNATLSNRISVPLAELSETTKWRMAFTLAIELTNQICVQTEIPEPNAEICSLQNFDPYGLFLQLSQSGEIAPGVAVVPSLDQFAKSNPDIVDDFERIYFEMFSGKVGFGPDVFQPLLFALKGAHSRLAIDQPLMEFVVEGIQKFIFPIFNSPPGPESIKEWRDRFIAGLRIQKTDPKN